MAASSTPDEQLQVTAHQRLLNTNNRPTVKWVMLIHRENDLTAHREILVEADKQAKSLEERTLARAKAKNSSVDLCQSDEELKIWLAQWSITQDDVSQQIYSASEQREQLDSSRSKGVHRVAAGTQRFLSQMGELSSGYSDLVEAVGGVAGPYGQAANAGFRALSCLFIAAANKTGSEALVTNRLEEINRFFPRINKLRAIYVDDTRIGVLVALIHLDVVHFADRAAHYFSNRWRRALDFFIPPGFKSDTTYDSMKTRLVELRAWANVNLHENSAKIHDEVVSARGQLREVHFQQTEASRDLINTQLQIANANEELKKIHRMIRKQEEEIERQLLTALKESLPIDTSSINFDLQGCNRVTDKIIEDLPLHRSGVSQATFMTRDRLDEEKSLIDWKLGTRRFLLIGGATNQDLMGLSWITPAVLGLAIEWSSESSDLLAFFSARPVGYQATSQRISFTHMLLGIVVQTIQQVPSVLREDHIRKAAKSLSKDCNEKWITGDVKELAQNLGLFLREASKECPIRIVVDRLDQIQDVETDLEDMLKCLNHIIVEVPNLKLLVNWSLTEGRKPIEKMLKPFSANIIHNLGLDLGFY